MAQSTLQMAQSTFQLAQAVRRVNQPLSSRGTKHNCSRTNSERQKDMRRLPSALLNVHTPRQTPHTTRKYHTWHTAYQVPFKQCDVTLHFSDDSRTVGAGRRDQSVLVAAVSFNVLSKLNAEVPACVQHDKRQYKSSEKRPTYSSFVVRLCTIGVNFSKV